MTELTDQDRKTVKGAAIGAMTFVSRADPGFLAMFKESMAGSKVLAQAPEDVRELFKGGGVPSLPGGEGDVDDRLLDRLTEAVTILQAKAPEHVEGFRGVILAACNAVAGASKGVSDDEADAIQRVRAALAASDAPGPAGGPAPEPGSGEPLPPPSGTPVG